MADPDVLADQARYAEVAKRHADLKGIVETFAAYRAAATDAADAAELATEEDDTAVGAELEAMAVARGAEAQRLESTLRVMLVPKDPNDQKDVIIEIRSAAGGDEAAIWAGDLYRMYERYAERRGWGIEPISSSPSEAGGFKEVTFAVKGAGAYSRLKFEAGSHRVQRVPKTESQGRIHTSIATVAVLPEAESVEVDVSDNDLEIDVFRSTGPGGQSVNTTDSAVRITHKPTGMVVTCQDEKSQLQNKLKALRVLRARLLKIEIDRRAAEVAADRKAQVGTGERAEKIRTYNFRENRVTDHRIGMTIKRLPEVLAGDLDEFIDALTLDDEARRLAVG
jgi:peptide chain release factor 1